MTIKSELISCEKVKPSSPTPFHLKTYKLSMIDQIMPHSPVPLLLYYLASNDTSSQKTEHLRSSLSLSLARFYPLAGRASEDCQSVDCNDQGVPYTVAKVKGHKLPDLLKHHPDPELTRELVPCTVALDVEWGPGCNVAMIQVNHFDCGGVVIGAVFWHKVADAVTIAHFVKHWAATAREPTGQLSSGPNYSFQSVFPQKQELRDLPNLQAGMLKEGKFLLRRCILGGPAIRRLKAEASKVVDSPTRVEVATALLWRCFMVASLANEKPVSAITHLVNMRRRALPRFASEYFGNLVWIAAASRSNREAGDSSLGSLVKEMRDATGKIDEQHVNRMQGDQGFSGFVENAKNIWSGAPDGADFIRFTSWCGMGFYDVDFGWGKPVWVTRSDSGSSRLCNLVWLMDTKLGDGVEAWVLLDDKYMQVFQNVEDLNNHASIDPSPLDFDALTGWGPLDGE